ncbi:hypothetical protein KL918_002917 [Ogataea parapolymorpha]|uniref:Uncharacterized protein n=1 Tax=Ogataea parapolymorpha (strain ATCC 26012 / BCRC 20466 / JCM 22074 / NRRL Y-7560 / DL-1) TaxID=871575 RepID=W1QI53_OGAPD|nr:hypothetical protein HPODL_00673 [Ogataea parapolymorpha DL-1]ESX01275.1 hypothetical protein HPODL_00673 [Ogataea parapolymorpha DL-1]KAG7867478.1 hypothetical protein KL918_002917 [Ogataea parapolymorpha]KAG7871864.1 hypothetical protein KL916_003714 [Ogataea parapolymorpha]KAG7883699.1 hypothetical protein KL938_002284 [Ogataea parapolymorpha]
MSQSKSKYQFLMRDNSLVSEVKLPRSSTLHQVEDSTKTHLVFSQRNLKALPYKFVTENATLNLDDPSEIPIVVDPSANTCQSLSSKWQVSNIHRTSWFFHDLGNAQPDYQPDVITSFLLEGSQSEVFLENGEDLIPNDDLGYVTQLVEIFVQRSQMLSKCSKMG